MALITCPECGKSVSDKAHRCPKCGFPLSSQKLICPECGSEITDSDKTCPNCGCPLRIRNNQVFNEKIDEKQEEERTDMVAVSCLISAIAAVFALPIIFVPVSIALGIFSSIRCHENPNLRGGILRFIAGVITLINVIFLIWSWSTMTVVTE